MKANIGHTLESAGIAGFLKAVLCMQNRIIPRQINFNTPNPEVPWDDIPFYVPRQHEAWPEPIAGRPRRTAVNAFGIGGLNVHVSIDDRIVERTQIQGQVPADLSSSLTVRPLSDDERAIAIVGAAAVLPGALTLSAFWDLLVSGRDPKIDVPKGRWSPEIYYDPNAKGLRRTNNCRGGFITDFVYDWKKHKVPPKQITNANPLQFMLLDAADQALRDSGYDAKPFDRQRACVIVGSVFGGDFACEMQMGLRIPEFQKHIRDELRSRGVPEADVEGLATAYQDLLLKHMPALMDETGSFTASTLASRLTKTFDMMGGAFSLDANDVSSIAAISAAMGMLQDKASDLVLCAAGQRSMDINVYETLQLRNVLASGDPRPAYAADANGVVPGEGAGVLILKRLSDARRDGDRIRGIIRSCGSSLHADDYGRACEESVRRALDNAGLPPSAVTVVETASIGVPDIDVAEVRALTQVLQSNERAVPAVVSSPASQVGHTLGVSGMVSLLKATSELEHGYVPPVAGLKQPIADLGPTNASVQPALKQEKLFATLPAGKTVAAVTNSAANGAVLTLLIEGGEGLPAAPRKPAAAPPVTKTPLVATAPSVTVQTRTIRLAATDRGQLAATFRAAALDAPQLYATGGTVWQEPATGVRVAIVSDSVEALEKQLRFAAEQLQRGESTALLDEKGIFVREPRQTPTKIAFLFPGQGSQYAGMLKPLVEQLPAAQHILAEMEDVLRACQCPSFASLAWERPEQLGSDVFITQLAMLVGNLLTFRVLESRGIRPDIIGCHSYGEFPALVAAGVMTLRDAVEATRERTRSVESRESTRGTLLSTTAPLQVVERILLQIHGGAYLASHNAPDQTVIGGTADAVQGVKKLLESEGFATRTLAVPRPYHTPLLADAQTPFAQALLGIPMQSPQLPMISSVSLQRVTGAAGARANLVDQLVTPVRYVQLVQQLAQDGATIFVEVGPNRVLTRLNQRILAGHKVSIVPTDVPQHPGLEGLTRLDALLAAAAQGTVSQVVPTAPVSKPKSTVAVTGQILFFDATQHRQHSRVVAEPAPAVTAMVAVTPESAPAPVAAPITTVQLDRSVVTKFMIGYVVDQTGYPEEMVELTADLEADLGIDSIKKAQLIGELAENFELTHLSSSLSDLSLDDFRTLESILDFVTKAPAGAAPAAVVESTATPVVAAAPVTAVATESLDRAAVTKFMIGYVVDQTGYPEEMVELTADLEADLGIDSIKKAQLIGELAENFELTHLSSSLSDLSLDDFRTLESILDFVTKAPAGAAPAAVVESTATPVVAAAPVTAVATESLDRAAVTKFMIGYVVDQTGYPEEMVELTADLEADLGIDSIKKAQLIGELAENFELTHLSSSLSDLSLDDFRTLESILDFVTKAPAGAAPAAVVESTATPVVAAAPVTAVATESLDRAAVTKFMIGYVVDQTGYPEEMVELTADLEADLGIDSIKKAQLIGELAENFELTHLSSSLSDLSLDDFRTLESILDFVTKAPAGAAPAAVIESTATPVVAATTVPQESTVSLDRAAVTKFMIGYVVDQTGYPEEMVELTADLEADLGIDSIKKAQLIGELAENFELTHLSSSLSDLSLDDFRTLESILDFVTKQPSQAPVAAAVPAAEPRIEAVPAQPAAAAISETRDSLPSAFSVVTMEGSAYEIGLQHGRSQAPAIRAIMERYAAMLGPRLQNMPELDEALAKPTMYFGESEIEELKGIAEGAGLHPGAVLAHNLGMYPDYVPGCTQFAFTRSSNPEFGLIHAVNEDSPLSLTLADCLSRIVQVRRPTGKIPHVTFSVSGQTGGLNGINAAGLAITSTLLLDCPRRKETAIGKVHPVIVKRLLENAETIEDAVRLLRTLERAGAWSLCLSEYQTDRLCYLEYDGNSLEVQERPVKVLTTNHCLLQPPVADVPEHSQHRLKRLKQLLNGTEEQSVSLQLAQTTLRDRFDLARGRLTPHATMNTIRRVDNQISIVMRPEHGDLFVTPGPHSGEIIDTYYRLDLKELLNSHTPAASRNGHVEHHAGTNGVAHRNGNGNGHVVAAKPAIDPREGLPAESTRLVQRHVLRVTEAPLPADAAALPALQGPVLILGQNKLSQSLAQRLQAAGVVVHQLPSDDTAVTEIERLWAARPAPHLFVTTAREEAAFQFGTGNWSQRSYQGALVPFLVCQKWAQLVNSAGLAGSATLIGVTAMGGDFGVSGRIHSLEGGGITGLFKGLRRELADMTVKVIDAPLEESPDALAASVLKEAAFKTGPLEVGSIRGRRVVVQAVPQAASAQRAGRRQPHGNWVVTGGARGVTAVVARELGRRFGLTMHLLGSTAEPKIDPSWRNLTEEGMKALKRTILDQARAAGKNPANTWKDVERSIEIDRTLQAFRADGIAVRYHACNVSDKAALATTLQAIRQQDGPIHGVIHGAGLEAACRFDKKKRDMVQATLAVKVDAAVSLIELLDNDPLEYFLGFGSTSGRFGGMGQSDYSMASDMLCKLCAAVRTHRPDLSAIGLHWPPWADVGMAARPESKIALQSSNLAFMPPMEGAAHVIDECLSQAMEGEILFLDKPDLIDTDGTMPDATLKAAYQQRDARVQHAAVVDTIHNLQPGRHLTATATFDPTRDPFLLEHRHQGQPILPAVVGIESMVESAMILANDARHVVGLHKMTVHQGLRFHNERSQRARVLVTQQGAEASCRLEADFCDRNGRLVESQRLQMEATLDLAEQYPVLAPVDLGPQPTNWTTHRYVVDWKTMKFPEEARVYHGYPFQALKDYALVEGGLWARLVVPPQTQIAGDRPLDGWQWPSATIDAGLLAADLMVWHTLHVADLPHAFERIQLARPLVPGEALTLRCWLRGRTDRMLTADFVMVDTAGKVVVRVDGYEMVEVKTGTSGKSVAATESATSAEPPAVPQAPAAPASAAEVPPRGDSSSRLAPARLPETSRPRTAVTNRLANGPAVAPAPLPRTVSTPAKSVPAAAVLAAPAAATSVKTPTIAADRIAALPLIEAARWENPDRLVTELRFDPKQDIFLDEHRFSDKPLLPAVIGLESMIETTSLTAAPGQVPVVTNFQIVGPCKFLKDDPQVVQVVAERSGTAWNCTLKNCGPKEIIYQTATVEFTAPGMTLTGPKLEQPPFPYSPMQYASKGQAQLTHGPRFQCLKGLSLQREWGFGKIKAAPADNLAGSRKGSQWFLPVATLDSCLVACGVDLFILMNKRVEVPNRCEELRIVRLPNADEVCTLRMHYKGHNDQHTTYDLYLYGANGDILLTMAGYRGTRTVKKADSSLWDGDLQDMK